MYLGKSDGECVKIVRELNDFLKSKFGMEDAKGLIQRVAEMDLEAMAERDAKRVIEPLSIEDTVSLLRVLKEGLKADEPEQDTRPRVESGDGGDGGERGAGGVTEVESEGKGRSKRTRSKKGKGSVS